MTNGQIFFARYPITIDTNVPGDFFTAISTAIFPEADFDIISSESIPISGGSGKTNAVMLIIARAKT